MSLIRSLISHFAFLGCPIYFEGCVPIGAAFPYGVLSLVLPAAFGGQTEVRLSFYECGGDSHIRALETMRRLNAHPATQVIHDAFGVCVLRRNQFRLSHEKGGVCVLHMTMLLTRYGNASYYIADHRTDFSGKEDCLC